MKKQKYKTLSLELQSILKPVYELLEQTCYFKESVFPENTGKRVGIEDESCPGF